MFCITDVSEEAVKAGQVCFPASGALRDLVSLNLKKIETWHCSE